MRNRKIFFCTGSMGHGGAERVIANLANYFAKNNDVKIITTKSTKTEYELSKTIECISLDKKNSSASFFQRTIKRVKTLRKILKDETPDIVISFLPEPSFRLMLAKTFLPIKTIISVRNDPNREYNNMAKRFLVKLLYTKADGFVFQTPDAKEWFSKKIQSKSVVIPNPIDKKFMRRPYDGKRENVIVNVGRLVEQKNQKLLIDAFCKFHEKHDGYVLRIYGDGPLKSILQKQINDLGLAGSIVLMGTISDIEEEIYKVRMFVLTSNYEGMPNALMEAMALGIPCISTDCPIGGPRYLIKNNKDGFLVEVGDIFKLEDDMEKIANNVELADKIGLAASDRMHDFELSKINLEWLKFIREVTT